MSINKQTINFVDSQQIKQISYTLSHFVIATILILCLKKYNPILLFVLLASMLSYICYSEQLYYMLPLLGFLLYIIDYTVMETNFNENSTFCQRIQNTLWKVPYYSILLYYANLVLKL